jgi:hypothetical protein
MTIDREHYVNMIWQRLEPQLVDFAQRIAASNPALTYSVGRSENAAFPLRAYATLSRSADAQESEVAVTVDAKAEDGRMTVSSDVCLDNGEVIAEGPMVAIGLSESAEDGEGALRTWIAEFEKFLTSAESSVAALVAKSR